MSAKRKTEEETITPVVPTDQPEAVTAGAPASDYVRIVNLLPHPKEFMLTDGRNVSCGPRMPGKKLNRSRKILRQHLHPHTRALADQGLIELEPVQEGEV
jgi:hypothetical protein